MNHTVFVAMSGGVDSSLAAALLLHQGYNVVGITMRVWGGDRGDESYAASPHCSDRAARDAGQVAAHLSIKHYVVNYLEPFRELVIDDFVSRYLAGETPNPCIRCNTYVKFGKLLEESVALGADSLATGHYARLRRDDATGRFLLLKGLDRDKDQSYALYGLTQQQLSRSTFPLGDRRKEDTRRMARELGLRVAHKQDSQEICFIPDGNYGAFLRREAGDMMQPGPILDLDGNQIGHHRGLALYTVGQRKGLGIAAGQPLYVVRLDPERNAVVVGPDSAVWGSRCLVKQVNWIAFDQPPAQLRAQVKIRYLHKEQDATIRVTGRDTAHVRFDEPQRAITPGQAAIFHDGDIVLGGGTIAAGGE
jgi:tRNA-specific 2-thiouridylase